MKAPSSERLYIEMRLDDWANWVIRIENGAEGWPKVSLLAILLEIGAVIRAPVKGSPFAYNRAEEVDCWVRRMGKEKPRHEAVIRSYYLRRHEPLKILIRQLNLSRTTFYDYLAEAKTWLAEKVHETLEPAGHF